MKAKLKKRIRLIVVALVFCCVMFGCSKNDEEIESTQVTEKIELEVEDTSLEMSTEEVSGTEECEKNEGVIETEIEGTEEEFTWTITDMDKVMYAKSSVNVRKGPDSSFEKLGTLNMNDEVKVTGKCNEYNWYRIVFNNNEAYVSLNYLVNEKVVIQEPESNPDNNPQEEENVTPQPEPTPEPESETPPAPPEETEQTIPEPAYGTIYTGDSYPHNGWRWVPIDVTDVFHIFEDNTTYWSRMVYQNTMVISEKPYEELCYYAEQVYPLRTDTAENGHIIKYPTFWVYLGDGPSIQ